MVEIRAPLRELKSERKVCGGCVQVHFMEECFSRAFHMEGYRRRLIPGSIPTIRKIEPGKQSSKRQHRKVSLVQFYLSFSIVSALKFSFFVEVSYMFIPRHLCDLQIYFQITH